VFLEHYKQNLCIDSCLYEGVESTLHTLKRSGYRLAIITNKPEVFVRPIINALHIGDLFDLILGGDSLSERKPSPLPLIYACEQLKVLPGQCVMVGDSKNDILAAKAANIQSIGLTYGYNYGEDISVYQPDWRFEHFSDLLTILKATH
jgi:phosphoglycolate phosphatase